MDGDQCTAKIGFLLHVRALRTGSTASTLFLRYAGRDANIAGSSFTVVGCAFKGCRVTHRGGAIRFSATVNGAITLQRTCFDACVTDGGGFDPETSRSDGGAVFFAQTSTALANIRENLCYGCEAGYEGGAFHWLVRPNMHFCNFTSCTAGTLFGGGSDAWYGCGGGGAFMQVGPDGNTETQQITYIHAVGCGADTNRGAYKCWSDADVSRVDMRHCIWDVTGAPRDQRVSFIEQGITYFWYCSFVGTTANLFNTLDRVRCSGCVFQVALPGAAANVADNRIGAATSIPQCWINSATPGLCVVQRFCDRSPEPTVFEDGSGCVVKRGPILVAERQNPTVAGDYCFYDCQFADLGGVATRTGAGNIAVVDGRSFPR